MKKSDGMPLPLARTHQLITKQLPDELIVYDLTNDKAHCLNESAAAIWNLCDGRTTPKQMGRKLQEGTGKRVDESLVWLALDQLDRDQLLTERLNWPKATPRMSRREAVRRIGVGAAIAIPVVFSITAPTRAQTGSCLPRGAPCTLNTECCSGNCRGNNQCA